MLSYFVQIILKNQSTKALLGCWNWAKYNTQAWLGSAGCATSGTDYEPTELSTGVSINGGNTGTYAFLAPALPVFEGWKAGTYPNEGMVGIRTGSGRWYVGSSEHATSPQFFEIDYTEVAAGSPRWYYDMIARQ